MSKLNIIIECIEKNNAVEKIVNIVVGAFINVLHKLQWVPNKLVYLSVIPLFPINYQI